MKTSSLLILFILFLPATIKAQYSRVSFQVVDKFTEIDTARYIVTYSSEVIVDTIEAGKKTDELCLEIGKRISKIYSLPTYKADSVSTDLMRKSIDNIVNSPGTTPQVIYKNYPDGKVTVINRSITNLFKYEEDYPIAFKWKLLPEKKVILNYTCQRAETAFRGRTYTAWFTPEIPLKEGRVKFGGLPGLILELSDSQNHYNYMCIGIEKPKTTTPIVYWSWKCTNTSREKYLDLSKKMHEKPLTYQRATGTGGMNFISPDGKITSAPDKPYPYNPMERE